MLRLDSRQVRHTFSYAAQQASGIGFWTRDREHVEKAFDFGGMGARNGVMAATMVAMGFSAVEDPFSGNENIYTALADKPAPEKLLAGLGSDYAVFGTTIKKWSVGAPLQSVLNSVAALLADPGVRADNIRHIRVDMPTASLRIVDNSTIPDLCLQHLVALMIVDRGATFASVHDVARMSDPKVLAVRKLVELVRQRGTAGGRARAPGDRADRHRGRPLAHSSHHCGSRHGAQPDGAKEVEAKALDLMAPVLGAGRANELIAADQRSRSSRARCPVCAGCCRHSPGNTERALEQFQFLRNRNCSSIFSLSHFRTENRIPLFLKMLRLTAERRCVPAPHGTCRRDAGDQPRRRSGHQRGL